LARDLLGAIYRWFTEGFDTLDGKEAKALLDRLNGNRVYPRALDLLDPGNDLTFRILP
jgi:hypothetical protein